MKPSNDLTDWWVLGGLVKFTGATTTYISYLEWEGPTELEICLELILQQSKIIRTVLISVTKSQLWSIFNFFFGQL